MKNVLHKSRIPAAILMLFFAAALLTGGFTAAWFTAESPLLTAARMLTGTVALGITETRVDSELYSPGSSIQWAPGESKDFSWTLRNDGSKRVILRAQPVVTVRPKDDTAWGEGTSFPGANWAMYFE